MFAYLKSFIESRVISIGIGALVAKIVSLPLAKFGVTVNPVGLQGGIFTAYQALAHLIEKKTIGGKWEWIGQIL